MNEPACADFTIAGVACRWQPLPPDSLRSARDWLREIAGAAAAGGLQRDARGRPRLPAGRGDIGWSHAGDRMLLAHAGSGIVGVDIERLDRRVDALRIARRHFADPETALLRELDDAARATAFLHLWCAKEAVLKAHGHGIAFGLSRVAFAVAGDALRMTGCDPALGDAADWRLHAFAPEPGYLAVLAACDGILRA
jgi:4'-phosphopantetheinyl transferase